MNDADTLAQMQAGTIAALAAFAEALVKNLVIDPGSLLQSLEAVSGRTMQSRLGPIGQATLDGLIASVRRLSVSPRGNPGAGH
jgi:hypothetical protein